mgnify:CR=1 FL=1
MRITTLLYYRNQVVVMDKDDFTAKIDKIQHDPAYTPVATDSKHTWKKLQNSR